MSPSAWAKSPIDPPKSKKPKKRGNREFRRAEEDIFLIILLLIDNFQVKIEGKGAHRMKVHLPYGKTKITLELSERVTVLSAEVEYPKALARSEISRALANPIGTPSLSELLMKKKPRTVAITISDSTRAVPNKVFMPEILKTLKDSGVPSEAVTIIVGTGMHRPSTTAELEELLGPEIIQKYTVIDHTADDPETLSKVSDTPYVAVNKIFAEADFRVVTGFIEPHFMAGYSGGRKGVCPAMVDLHTIQRFHGFRTLSNPLAKEGVLEGNPCHSAALEVAQAVGVDFLFNVAINREKEIVGIYCGDLEKAHARGCADIALWSGVKLTQKYDFVITNGGGYPLDQNFYQTVKGMCMALPALHDKSTLLVVSSCAQQLGSPEYTDLMKKYDGRWQEFLEDIEAHSDTTAKDQWELQMQCRVLERIGSKRLLFFSDEMNFTLQKQSNVSPILGDKAVGQRLQETIDRICHENPKASIAVIPDGPYAMLLE